MRILNRPMFRSGGPIREGIMHGMKNGGRIGFKDGPKRKQYKLEEAPIGKFGNWLGDKAVPGSIYYGLGTPVQTLYDIAAVPTNAAARLFGYNPGLSGTKFVDTLTGGNFSKFTGFNRDKALGTSAKQGWTTPSMQDGPTAAELELAALKKKYAMEELAKTGKMPDHLGLKPLVDPNISKDLAQKQQKERIQNYLKMMGYDTAKKGAMSKALIDASALVQNASTEAGSLKHADWGNLINKAIQTTSKRLEKPEQIREAVGLMATKAAIQKDMTAEEDALKTKALKLKIKESERALNPTAADLALLAAGKTGKITQSTLENMVRKIAGVDKLKATFKDEKDTAYADWLDDNPKASSMKFMTDVVSKQSDFSPGFYVFPDRVIEVKDDLTMSWWH